jgi:predicted AAA+ superfamily ATPase
MCIDYHALNKIMTIKNNYPLPWIDDLFDCLNEACYFNWMDLKLGYYQIRIVYAFVEKMVMKTRYDFYEFLVILFGLRNAPSTTFMDFIFHDKLDEFIIIYFDDILVYFELM